MLTAGVILLVLTFGQDCYAKRIQARNGKRYMTTDNVLATTDTMSKDPKLAEEMTTTFKTSGKTISLRGNSEVKLAKWEGNPAVYKALRFYRNKVDPEKVALFKAEADMATIASNKGVGCPVYYSSAIYTAKAMPMIVMKPMGLGLGDAIKAGADPAVVIPQLIALFNRLKASKVYWEDTTSPNNIMTDTTDVSAITRWYFIDFGTSVATAAQYAEKANSFATKPELYDQMIATFWSLLSNWISKGLRARVDFNKTEPGVDPQNLSTSNITNPEKFVALKDPEPQNMRTFKTALKESGKWPDWAP